MTRGWRCRPTGPCSLLPLPLQVFVNFAKKQSDNLEQQETSPSCALQSPLERVLSLLRPRAAPTELRALVVEEQEDLETDDEGLISFEEERVRGCPQIWVSLVPAVSLPQGTGAGFCVALGLVQRRGHGRTRGGPERALWEGWLRPAQAGSWPQQHWVCWVERAAPAQPLSPACLCAHRLSSHSTRTPCAETPQGQPHPLAVKPPNPFGLYPPFAHQAELVRLQACAREDTAGAALAWADLMSYHPPGGLCPSQLRGSVTAWCQGPQPSPAGSPSQCVPTDRDCEEKDTAWCQCGWPCTLCGRDKACERCLQLDTHVSPTLATPGHRDTPTTIQALAPPQPGPARAGGWASAFALFPSPLA